MKTERRHELQTNALADSMAHWIEGAKPYARTAAGLLLAIVVLIFAYVYVTGRAARNMASGWDAYFQALGSVDRVDRGKLSDIAEEYPSTPLASWADVTVADLDLNEGANQLFHDASEGREDLRKAVDAYEKVLAETRDVDLRQRATFGLARAQESLGDLNEARKQYKVVIQQWPQCVFAQPASDRVEDLERASTKEFYDWFAKQDPGRKMSSEPGLPGFKPPFSHDSLPDAGSGGSLPPLTGPKGDAQSETSPEGDNPHAPADAPSEDSDATMDDDLNAPKDDDLTAPKDDDLTAPKDGDDAAVPATTVPATTAPAKPVPASPAKPAGK